MPQHCPKGFSVYLTPPPPPPPLLPFNLLDVTCRVYLTQPTVFSFNDMMSHQYFFFKTSWLPIAPVTLECTQIIGLGGPNQTPQQLNPAKIVHEAVNRESPLRRDKPANNKNTTGFQLVTLSLTVSSTADMQSVAWNTCDTIVRVESAWLLLKAWYPHGDRASVITGCPVSTYKLFPQHIVHNQRMVLIYCSVTFMEIKSPVFMIQ